MFEMINRMILSLMHPKYTVLLFCNVYSILTINYFFYINILYAISFKGIFYYLKNALNFGILQTYLNRIAKKIKIL